MYHSFNILQYIIGNEKAFVKHNIYHERALCLVYVHVPYVSILIVLNNKKFSCLLFSAGLAPIRDNNMYEETIHI